MTHTSKKLDKSQVELKITIEPKDYEKHLEPAGKRLSQRKAIKGFRPGKAPLATIKKEFGEMAILQEALESIIQEAFYSAIKEEKLDTLGMPQINIEKLAPENDIVFTAIVAILPKIELPDLEKITVKKEKKPIDEKQIDETLNAVRGMNAKEILKTDKAEGTDKLVLDMDMLIDNVPVEGGQSKDYQVYLSEDHYIPGFNKQVEGLKKDDEKEFSLEFPKDHYQKNLAGKKVDFKVKVKDVYERQLPELSDEMAKKLGQESVAKLKELIKNNLEQEAEQKANQSVEIEMLDKIIEKTNFDELPDVLVDAERQKMFFELKADLDKHGIEIDQYLNDLKKTQEELYEGFKEQAEKRAKAALISKQVANDNDIKVDEKEIDEEIKIIEAMYQSNQEYLDRLKKPEVRDTIAMTIQNRKVIEWLKNKIVKNDNKKAEAKNVDKKDEKEKK